MSDGVTDIFSLIANAAGNASNTTGDISTGLLNLGFGVEAVRQMLQQVAGNLGGDPQKLAVLTDELRYINSGGTVGGNRSNTNTLLIVGAAIALTWYLASRRNN